MRQILATLKRGFDLELLREILHAGLKHNFIYSNFVGGGDYENEFRPISIDACIKNMTEGNEDYVRAISVKIEDTYIPVNVLENDNNKNETLVIITWLPYFWSKEFINSSSSDKIEADYARYFRALLRWLKEFDIVDFVFEKDFVEDEPSFTGDEFRSISIDFDLRYLKKGDELKHFYTNSLIHGYEFTDDKGNKVELDEIKNTLDANESLKLYFTAQGYPIELYVYSFSISLKPLEPFKKRSKEGEELLLDWPFYIEVALQLIEGFWIDDFRIK